MGIGDFLSGAGRAVGNFGNDLWNANREFGEGGVKAVSGGLHAVDKLLQGPVKHGIEKPQDVPNIAWNANREIGEAGVATTKGVVKAGQFVVEHPVESYKIGNAISKQIIMDQLKPENIVTNVALAIASGGTSVIAKSAEAGVAGFEAFRAGEGGLSAAKSGVAAFKGTKEALSANELAEAGVSAGKKFFSGPTKYATGEAAGERGVGATLGKIGEAKANAVGDLRESVGLGRQGLFQQGRQYYGEQIAERFPGAVGENAGRMVANAPGAPTTGGRFAEMMYEGRQGVGLASNAQQARTGIHVAADPTKFATEQFSAHKGEALDYAERKTETGLGKTVKNKVLSKVKDKVLGDDDDEPQQSTVRQPQAQVTPGMASNWQAPDSGGFVSTPSKKRSTGALTTTSDSTMSGAVGPSEWYGGQNTYGSGRGFGGKPFGTTPWQKDPAYT